MGLSVSAAPSPVRSEAAPGEDACKVHGTPTAARARRRSGDQKRRMKLGDELRHFSGFGAGEAAQSVLQDEAACFLEQTRRCVATGVPLWKGAPAPPLLSEEHFDRQTGSCWNNKKGANCFYTAKSFLEQWRNTKICGVCILEQSNISFAAVLLWSSQHHLEVYAPFAPLALMEDEWITAWKQETCAADALQDFTELPASHRRAQVERLERLGAGGTPKELLGVEGLCACRCGSVALVAAARAVGSPNDVALAREAVQVLLRFFPMGEGLSTFLPAFGTVEVSLSFDSGLAAKAEATLPRDRCKEQEEKSVKELLLRPVLQDMVEVVLCRMVVSVPRGAESGLVGGRTAFEKGKGWTAAANRLKCQEGALRRAVVHAEKQAARLTLYSERKDMPALGQDALVWGGGRSAERRAVVPSEARDPQTICRLLLQSILCHEPPSALVEAAARRCGGQGVFDAHFAVAHFLPAEAALLLMEEGRVGRLGTMILHGPTIEKRAVCFDSARRAQLLPWVCTFVVHGSETSRVVLSTPKPIPARLPNAHVDNDAAMQKRLRLVAEEEVVLLRKKVRLLQDRLAESACLSAQDA